eukprot:SAG11_NODE_874_length_6773_cov_4.639114_5_plen_89_part_00
MVEPILDFQFKDEVPCSDAVADTISPSTVSGVPPSAVCSSSPPPGAINGRTAAGQRQGGSKFSRMVAAARGHGVSSEAAHIWAEINGV